MGVEQDRVLLPHVLGRSKDEQWLWGGLKRWVGEGGIRKHTER